MSLLSYASPWKSENSTESSAPSRKRIPSIGKDAVGSRKTIKSRPPIGDQFESFHSEEGSGPETIDQLKDKQTAQNTHVNSILNRITSFSNDDRLGDFNPMPYPNALAYPPKLNPNNSEQIIPAERPIEVEENPLMPSTRVPNPERRAGAYYKPAEPASAQYMNYKQAYGREGLVGQNPTKKEPYYAKMGIGSGSGDKIMDRINYMTQMLESLQMEKTNHVTEEFVLYTLLGVFMIYIVDGFSRGGKYVR